MLSGDKPPLKDIIYLAFPEQLTENLLVNCIVICLQDTDKKCEVKCE